MLRLAIHCGHDSGGVLAAASGDSGMASVLGWSLVLIAMLVGAFFAIARLRAWLKKEDTPASVGFSLTDLRALHRAGKMTDEEFEKARNLMVAQTKRMTANLPHPLAASKLRAPRGAEGASPAKPSEDQGGAENEQQP
jgi:hypothetical protein